MPALSEKIVEYGYHAHLAIEQYVIYLCIHACGLFSTSPG